MKGIIFTEFLEMVENQFGFTVADNVITKSEASLPSGGVYTAVGTYSHGEMVTLVTNLSEEIDTPVGDLLKAYGEYMFVQFVKSYPVFFENVTDAFSFLSKIENYIHVEVLKLYPDAELPRFDISQPTEKELEMIYHSERKMADFAEGLIIGCVDYYKEQIVYDREELSGDGKAVRFFLQKN